MFITKSEYKRITRALASLQRQVAAHERFLHNDHEKLNDHGRRVKLLEERVGADWPSIYDSSLLQALYFKNSFGVDLAEPKPRKLSLTEKVQAIMEYMGLTVVYAQAEAKLVKKPVKSVKKATAKKAKK